MYRSRAEGCWETETLCSGDKLIKEHASRISWWLVTVLVVVALILVGLIAQRSFNTQMTGPWSNLHASSWIQPTPRALGSLVGIAIVLDMYTSYMMALKRGHLDRMVGQFLLTSFIRTSLWIYFLYGLSYGGDIGSMFSLILLAVILAWGFMTSHSCAPLHSWISMVEFIFVLFLIVWLATSSVTVVPSP